MLRAMHPYRTAPVPEARDEAAPAEEWILGGLLAVIAGARVVVAFATREELGADVTIAGILCVLGVVLLARLALTRARS